MIYNKNIICVLIIVLSLILIFEVEIRSIGTQENDTIESIELLSISMLRISIFGILLPIIFAYLLGKFNVIFHNNRILYFLVSCFVYGLLIFFIRSNPLKGLGGDILVYFGLFTGLCLGVLLPNMENTIAAGLTLTSVIPTLLATALLFSVPGGDFMTSFERTTHPSAFILLGLPLSLSGPAMIYSILHRNIKWIAISWLSAGVLLVITISILQTRSLTIAVFFSVIIAIFTSISTANYFKKKRENRTSSKILGIVIVVFILFVITTLFFSRGNLIFFLLRMENVYEFQEDGGISPRLEEVPQVFGSMDFFDHIFGMGFNPVSPLIDWKGNSYNSTHVGILNIWWRFGLPVFLVVIYLFARLIIKYFKCFKYIFHQSLWKKVNNETFATIICAPGVITIFVISCMSGGWGVSTTISLGILWGVYWIIATNPRELFIKLE